MKYQHPGYETSMYQYDSFKMHKSGLTIPPVKEKTFQMILLAIAASRTS